MSQVIFNVTSFRIVAPFTLAVTFDDGLVREIDFQPLLAGPLFGPLAELTMFNQVHLDPEVKTLVWPNGADFDPERRHIENDLRHNCLLPLSSRRNLGPVDRRHKLAEMFAVGGHDCSANLVRLGGEDHVGIE